MDVSGKVNFDTPRQIKTPFDWCMNDGRFYKSHHEADYFVFELAKGPAPDASALWRWAPMPMSWTITSSPFAPS